MNLLEIIYNPCRGCKDRVSVRARANTISRSFLHSHTLHSHSRHSHTYHSPSHPTLTLLLEQVIPILSILPVMFDFEKLTVYKKAKIFNAGIRALIKATRYLTTFTFGEGMQAPNCQIDLS